jgi:hypothetical protein
VYCYGHENAVRFPAKPGNFLFSTATRPALGNITTPFKEVLRALFLTVNRSKLNISYHLYLIKVKQFHYTPGQAQSVPGY